jgi:hypothetical protein
MSKIGKVIREIQEYASHENINRVDLERWTHRTHGDMFVDIALDYYDTQGDSLYDEMNDIQEYENLLIELGLEE